LFVIETPDLKDLHAEVLGSCDIRDRGLWAVW